MAVRNYDAMLETLSELIRFKNKADAITWRDAFENMDVYLEVGCRIGFVVHARAPCVPDTHTHTYAPPPCACALGRPTQAQPRTHARVTRG
jgi:hypothetical protein